MKYVTIKATLIKDMENLLYVELTMGYSELSTIRCWLKKSKIKDYKIGTANNVVINVEENYINTLLRRA